MKIDFNFSKIDIRSFHTLVFDFDGVFTNNKVLISENGNEFVSCDRGDGLAFNILDNYLKLNNIHLDYFILSKEKNLIVSSRAKKLGIICHQGIDSKFSFIDNYLDNQKLQLTDKFNGLIYVGNDLNDLKVMRHAGLSIAPIDSHNRIIEIAKIVIKKNGGESFVREVIEKLIKIEDLSLEEIEELV